MAKIVATTGNSAMAYAMKQINPDVCAASPHHALHPGHGGVLEVRGRRGGQHNLVTLESEHSAMKAACIGAAAAGRRVLTATSAITGWPSKEMLYIAAPACGCPSS